MASVIFRTGFIYLLLICIIRLTGKRQIGELQLSELVTTILISEVAASPITNLEIPLLYAVLPITFLIACEITLSFLTTKFRPFKKLIEGTPSFLIRQGRLNQKELSRQRISLEELLSNLRQKDISAIQDVNYAILEQNGRVSVFPYDSQAQSAFAHAIVIDGHVKSAVLKQTAHDPAWLEGRLKAHKTALDDIFLFTVDDNGKEFLVRKEKD